MEYTINLNQELNGIELIFATRPAAAILEKIKLQGFRWNNKKSLWYAKQTPDRLAFAKTLEDAETTSTGTKKAEKATAKEYINMDGVQQKQLTAHGADLAKIIREELKNRGVKNATVRSRRITYDTGITITVKATNEDIASIEEFKERYNFSHFAYDVQCHGRFTGQRWTYTLEGLADDEKETLYNNYVVYTLTHSRDFSRHNPQRKDYPEFTTAFFEKLKNIFLIANQWNYDNSDSMTDYFDVGYYLDIDIKAENIQPRQNMTEEERTAYKAELEAEERERAESIAKYEREQKEAEEAAKRYEEERKAAETAIYNNIKVIDLEKEKQFFCYGLIGGIGKEATLNEVDKTGRTLEQGALVTRKVIFTDPAIFESFSKYLLNDFDFLAGMGGTASEDPRITNENYYKLTEKQRNTVEFYMNNCVAIYVNDTLKLVIDPQGYNYARYTYIAEGATIKPALTELERMSNPGKPDFYIPEPIKNQIANININDDITVYMCDGWILTTVENGRGTVKNIYPSEYAQYKGYTISFNSGKSVFVRDGKEILIYKGIKNRLPESVTSNRISDTTRQILTVFDGLFDRVYNYYLEQGEKPLLDTIAK